MRGAHAQAGAWAPGSQKKKGRSPSLKGEPCLRLLQALDADARQSLEIWDRAIDHVDAVDAALPAPEVEGTCPLSLPDEMPYGDVIRLAIGVNDLRVQHFDIGAAHVQANRFEPSLAAPHGKGVTIAAE